MKNSLRTVAVLTALMTVAMLFGSCTESFKPSDCYISIADYKSDGGWAQAFDDAVEYGKSQSKNNVTLFIPKGNYEIEGRVLIPLAVSLVFEEGASVTVKEDGKFIMNGRSISAPKKQIFINDGGSISGFGSVSVGYPEWFGAVASDGIDDSEAIESATKVFSVVRFGEGVYNIDKGIKLAPASKTSDHLTYEGEGSDKTVIETADGITAFCYNGTEDRYTLTCFEAHNMAFCEKSGARTGIAIECGGSSSNSGTKSVITGCSFKGYGIAFKTYNSGMVSFNNNYAENNRIVSDIGAGSMFLFFKYDTAKGNGKFINCDIGANGGLSNGIDVVECTVSDSEENDLYITENQAVFLLNDTFDGCKGDSVCYKGVSDFRIVGCTFNAGKSNGYGCNIEDSNSSYIKGNTFNGYGTALRFKGPSSWRAMSYITENVFEGSKTADVEISRAKDIKIVNNIFKSASALPITGERAKAITVAANTFYRTEYTILTDGFSDSVEYGNVFNG